MNSNFPSYESDSQSYDPLEAMSVPRIAYLLGVSDPTVRRWIRDGDLPSLELNGCRRIFRKDLDAYLAFRRKYGLRPLGQHQPPVPVDEWSGQIDPHYEGSGSGNPF